MSYKELEADPLVDLPLSHKLIFDKALESAAKKQKVEINGKLGRKGLENFIEWCMKILMGKHWLERKNKTMGQEKIFYLLYCKSNIYVYI